MTVYEFLETHATPEKKRSQDNEADRSRLGNVRTRGRIAPDGKTGAGRSWIICKRRGLQGTVLLSKDLGVSEVSIRKDFHFLERQGLVKRIHGGAQMTQSGLFCLNLSEKYTVNRTVKQQIAWEAVRCLDRPGLQIYIDTGTTNAFFG